MRWNVLDWPEKHGFAENSGRFSTVCVRLFPSAIHFPRSADAVSAAYRGTVRKTVLFRPIEASRAHIWSRVKQFACGNTADTQVSARRLPCPRRTASSTSWPHGVTKEEIAAIVTHVTMYVGWPKGWAVFRLAKEVWGD